MVSYRAREPTEVMAQVPLVRPRPSLLTRVSRVLMPALAMASAPVIFSPLYMAMPLPSRGRDIWARGARSPEEPREPF